MHTLWYVFGGIALLRLADNSEGIGRIVDGKPPGVTPCLDGKFSTHTPGRGVCSYHAGWKGTTPKKKVEEVPDTFNTPLPTIEPPKNESIPFWKRNDRVIELAPNEKGIYLVDLDYETARRAHMGTSFSPDKRGQQEVEGHRKFLFAQYNELAEGRTVDQLAKLNQLWEPFVDRYTKYKTEALLSRSNVMSTMITGPANFPVRRMQKARNAFENKVDKLIKFKQKFEKRVKKDREIYPEYLRTEPIKHGGGESLDLLENKLSKALEDHELMKLVNKTIRSGGDVVRKLRDAGVSEEIIENVYVSKMDKPKVFQGFHLANSNGRIRALRERVAAEKKILASRQQGEKEMQFAGGTVSEAHADNRLRIYFDDIPTPEMRTKLKRSGWRWSPKNKAWQRQLTRNAWISAESVLNLRP